MLQTPLPADVSLTEMTLGGVPVLEISVPEAIADAALLYFHGGVFALGSARASAGLACLLARQSRAKVLSVDYRLAPEHPYPAATDDALGSYRGLLETGIRRPPRSVRCSPICAGSHRCSSNAVRTRCCWMTRRASPPRRPAPTSPSNWTVTPGAPHVFQASAPELAEANAALARTGAFLRAHLQPAE